MNVHGLCRATISDLAAKCFENSGGCTKRQGSSQRALRIRDYVFSNFVKAPLRKFLRSRILVS
jgi:hypothetical protein